METHNKSVYRSSTPNTEKTDETKEETDKGILTAIINSKGCLYTLTGDWYFCTMIVM